MQVEPTLILAVALASNAFGAALTDNTYLGSDIWNDGQAEIAFYQVERKLDQYGRENPQSFLMGTYLVKHDYDPTTASKARRGAADRVSAFKWAAFYEFESDNSYQYKRNYVVNATQSSLAPLKQSFTSFDWCSNQYRELVFGPDGKVDALMRSDDYGNAAESFAVSGDVYPVSLVPLLVRALDFSSEEHHRFSLVGDDGTVVRAVATFVGREDVTLPSGPAEAERIVLRYEGDFRGLISRRGATEETYWRAPTGARLLLKVQAESYRVELVEQLRSPYWAENVYERLERVKTRP